MYGKTRVAWSQQPPPAGIVLGAPWNPWVSFTVYLPALQPATYMGEDAGLLQDFRSVLMKNADVPSIEYVRASYNADDVATQSASSSSGVTTMRRLNRRRGRSLMQSSALTSFPLPVTIYALVWFPTNWMFLLGPTPGQTSLDWLVFRLLQLPSLVLQHQDYPRLNISGVQVTDVRCSVATPSLRLRPNVGGGTQVESSIPNLGNDVLGWEGLAAQAPELLLLQNMSGAAYLETPFSPKETFIEPPVAVYDIIDANSLPIYRSYMICRLPPGGAAALAVDMTAGIVDLIHSGVNCSGGAAALYIDMTRPNQPGEVYVIKYSAWNSRGIPARPRFRLVVITDACGKKGEYFCFELGRCSVGGMCVNLLDLVFRTISLGTDLDNSGANSSISGSGSTPTTSNTPVFNLDKIAIDSADKNGIRLPVPKDTQAPRLLLMGLGKPYISTAGEPVILDEVPYGSAWTDPGATAFDIDEFGATINLTNAIQAYGITAVDTFTATPPPALHSYVIRYSVTDSSGVAAVGWRLIKIICTPPETFCVDDEGEGQCTVSGVCGFGRYSSAFNSAAGDPTANGGGSASSGSAEGSSKRSNATSQWGVEADGWEPMNDPSAPRIALRGPRLVEIPQFGSFDRCMQDIPVSLPCDAGARVLDPLEGDLSSRLRVCGQPFTPSSTAATAYTTVPVLLACNISSSIPGVYTITYDVFNSGGKTAATLRTLVVRAACLPGEQLCGDNVTCSVDQVCLSELGSIGKLGRPQAAGVVSQQQTPPNQAPTIELRVSEAASMLVHVMRGARYDYCNGSVPTFDQPCEPGARATDPDGAVSRNEATSSSVLVALDLTGAVIACPPAACLSAEGCTTRELESYTLRLRGLAGCGINTLAPVGTIFPVDFWVWDNARANATVRRYVTISDPCATSTVTSVMGTTGNISGSPPLPTTYCEDPQGGFFCSPLPCSVANRLKTPVLYTPALAVLPSVAYVEYGKVPKMYLGPCTSINDTSGCSVFALGLTVYGDGRRMLLDLTGSITVQPTISCEQSSGDSKKQCTTCTMEMLHLPRGCPPGTYKYKFTASNGYSEVTSYRTVHVYYKSSTLVSFPSPLSAPADFKYNSATLVAEHAAAINTSVASLADTSASILPALITMNATEPYKMAFSYAADHLAALGYDSSDIQLLGASTEQVSTATTVLRVAAAIHTYLPSAVHRGAVTDFDNFTSLFMNDPSFRHEKLLEVFGYNTSTGTVRLASDADISSITRHRRELSTMQPDDASDLKHSLAVHYPANSVGGSIEGHLARGSRAQKALELDGTSHGIVEDLILELLMANIHDDDCGGGSIPDRDANGDVHHHTPVPAAGRWLVAIAEALQMPLQLLTSHKNVGAVTSGRDATMATGLPNLTPRMPVEMASGESGSDSNGINKHHLLRQSVEDGLGSHSRQRLLLQQQLPGDGPAITAALSAEPGSEKISDDTAAELPDGASSSVSLVQMLIEALSQQAVELAMEGSSIAARMSSGDLDSGPQAADLRQSAEEMLSYSQLLTDMTSVAVDTQASLDEIIITQKELRSVLAAAAGASAAMQSMVTTAAAASNANADAAATAARQLLIDLEAGASTSASAAVNAMHLAEAALGEVEYVWINCGDDLADDTQRALLQWRFHINVYSATDVDAGDNNPTAGVSNGECFRIKAGGVSAW
ncbi:hypothetical protein VOLCADRAFT_93090 [Volvox carteri f. nagariensis]|uniref:Uncharacterized protein n=1 Tax=Volvox carteri f. nagariensis TaxID=3068 RepID=D8U1B5_VOLCA|nr:uncharacterized protein VOLCADRAFT_93090 [Volvox carteri f. nagariensis]EFJ46527.1 hypothetical protein VOLCADRAFT_93090 [Volvox carteri f. nagariensis]|eukprot:XP_002952384.1 hypothetical protein VOLCADRAFT_93090 [Volvox carteri f. nagariensis]